MEPKSEQPIRVARCPMCDKPRELEFRPFCSKRCADLDLSRWFNGAYAMPAAPDEDDALVQDFADESSPRR